MHANQDSPFYALPVDSALEPDDQGAFTSGAITGRDIRTYNQVARVGFRIEVKTLEAAKVVAVKVQHSADDGAGSPASWGDVPTAVYMPAALAALADPANWGAVPSNIAADGVLEFFVDTTRGELKDHVRLVATPNGTGFIVATAHLHQCGRLPFQA